MTTKPRISTKFFAVVAAIIVVLDQWSKYLAVAHLTRAFDATRDAAAAVTFGDKLSRFLWTENPAARRPIAVLDNFWHWRYAENTGSAFSFLADANESFRMPFFLTVTILAMAFIISYFRKSHPEAHIQRIALALVFGGALGNFIDRARLGYVIDFISWHWYTKATWPTFNVADSAISVGVVFLLLAYKEPEPVTEAKAT